MVESHQTTPAPDTSNVDANDPRVRCFVAYPSSAQDRAETIETAIDELNNGGAIEVFGWKQLKIGGRLVIGTICDEIKRCEVFIADITGLNPNVLFELGYAIAQKKRVWLLLNSHIERADRIRKI